MSLRMMKAVWSELTVFRDRAGMPDARGQAKRPAEEGVCERGARAFWGSEAAHTQSPVRGENAYSVAFQCETRARFHGLAETGVLCPHGTPVLKRGLVCAGHAHGGKSTARPPCVSGDQGEETRAQRIFQGKPGCAADAVSDAAFAHADTRSAGHGRGPSGAGPPGPGGAFSARRHGGRTVSIAAPRQPRREVSPGWWVFSSIHASQLRPWVIGCWTAPSPKTGGLRWWSR